MVISDRQMGHPQLAAKSDALSCQLMHSCSAMDKHMQHAVFHTIAFLAFSCLAFSTLASWCRKFMSRIFHPCDMVPHFHVPQFHVSHFQHPHASAVLAMGLCVSVCLSVRLSQVGVLLKRLKVGSHKQLSPGTLVF